MWIIPKNYHLYSAFAQDMVASKEDLISPDLNIELSLMSKSKPMPLRTLLTKWKTTSFHQHLFIRILKHSHRKSFETELTSSLEVIRVSHSQQQEPGKERKTPDISGRTLGDTSNQLDLFGSSLKTSADTLRLDSTQLSATWKKMVLDQRGEYSRRLKSARPISDKESGSWATPNTMDHLSAKSPETLLRQSQTVRKGRTRPSNLREQVDPTAVKIYQGEWPTATVFDVTGGSYPTELVNGKWRSKHSKDPDSPWYGAKLKDAVETAEKLWPTPSARDVKGPNGYESTVAKLQNGDRAHMGQLPNAVMIANNGSGHLNPDWVEWLMGVPTGWTALGSWETE